MDDVLKAMAESPITSAARANKIFLPLGKRSAPRAERREIPPEDIRASRESRDREAVAKVSKLLDYYAGTEVPFERIASHMKMDIGKVRESMKFRGRLS